MAGGSSSFKSLITSGLAAAVNEKAAASVAQAGMGGIKMNTAGGLQVEVAALRETVERLKNEGAQGYLMDADDIYLSPLANRHEMAFLTEDFKRFCQEIDATKGNVQPVGVVDQGDGKKLLVFGHRRRRACKQMGHKVRVIDIPGPISMDVLMKFMHAENAERADLTVFEQGRWYHEALQQGVYATAVELAQSLGVTDAWVSKALMVARLPEDVIKAFPNPLEITSKMGEELTKALRSDEDAVMYRALELQEPRENGAIYTAQETFLRLMFPDGVTRAEKPRPMRVSEKAKPFGKINRDAKGRVMMALDPAFTRDDVEKIKAAVLEIAKKKAAFLPKEKKAAKKSAPKKPAAE